MEGYYRISSNQADINYLGAEVCEWMCISCEIQFGYDAPAGEPLPAVVACPGCGLTRGVRPLSVKLPYETAVAVMGEGFGDKRWEEYLD